MSRIRWTNEAIIALASLTPPQRRPLFDRLDLIAQFPAMYPRRQRGRVAGLHYFVLEKRWLVYYRQDEGGDIKQRHLDLFMGYGKPARQAAFGLKNLARIKITKLCTSSAVKGVKNSKAPEATPTCETIP